MAPITPKLDGLEELRSVLELEHNREFSIDETKEIGDSLITLYQVLGGII